MRKIYISAQQLLEDSLALGLEVLDSGFRPELVLGVWRGGSPVGIAVQEVLALAGIACDHMAVRTRSYLGIDERGRVEVDGLEYLDQHFRDGGRLLIVDDVFDTGLSMQQLIADILARYPEGGLEYRVATPWFKPSHNRSRHRPDYYRHTTADWLVFPHELAGLEADELRAKPGLGALADRLAALTS